MSVGRWTVQEARGRGGEDVARRRGHVVLAERLAHVDALRGEEGVGHAAADHEMFDLAHEMCPAARSWSRPWRRPPPPPPAARASSARPPAPSVRPPSAGRRRRAGAAPALRRRMRAVRGREGVVDIDIAQRGQRRGEDGVVGLLAGMEAGVLQQQHRIPEPSRRPRAWPGPDAVRAKPPGRPAPPSAPAPPRRSDISGTGLPLGRPKCASSTGRAPCAVMSGSSAEPPRSAWRVGDAARLDRHVQVHPHQRHLAGEIHVVEALPAHACRSVAVSLPVVSDRALRQPFGMALAQGFPFARPHRDAPEPKEERPHGRDQGPREHHPDGAEGRHRRHRASARHRAAAHRADEGTRARRRL
jgi:hypothetical protein